MTAPIAINVTTQAKPIWSGRRGVTGVNTLLLMNTDLLNTVYVGSDLTSLVVPIAPNGSLSVDPSDNWYVQGLVAGNNPLVILPNGQNTFLGLTQGLGNLAIPSMQSPNFLTGVQGWKIGKDGSAEFNNIVVRGNAQFGNGFFSNGDGSLANIAGLYIYSGTPAAGNLIYTVIASNVAGIVGHDKFNNNVLGGTTQYQNGLSTVSALQILNGISLYYQAASLQPIAPFVQQTSSWDIFRSATIGGGPVLQGAEVQDFISFQRSGSGSNAWMYSNNGFMQYDAASGDGNTYTLGKVCKTFSGSMLVNSTAFTTVGSLSIPVSSGRMYRFRAKGIYTSTFAAGNAILSLAHPGTNTYTTIFEEMMWTASGSGVQLTQSGGSFIDVNSPTLSTATWTWTMEGFFQPSANETVSLSAACSIAADTWTLTRAFLEVECVG